MWSANPSSVVISSSLDVGGLYLEDGRDTRSLASVLLGVWIFHPSGLGGHCTCLLFLRFLPPGDATAARSQVVVIFSAPGLRGLFFPGGLFCEFVGFSLTTPFDRRELLSSTAPGCVFGRSLLVPVSSSSWLFPGFGALRCSRSFSQT